jgi:para-nitrobenzyl esterase
MTSLLPAREVSMKRYRKLSGILVLVAATALVGASGIAGLTRALAAPPPHAQGNPPPHAQGAGKGPTVSTQDGPVKGFVKNGVNTFLGIPYAAPPVGDLRWMPPQTPEKHGLLDATEFGNTCPQVTTLGPFAGPTSIAEDCLYLNVFTTSTQGDKPVIVWIHGGGNITGETNDYDGSKLATGGPLGTPTVVVTINYRLGLFGFISESHLNDEGHPWGNYGILDQQAALRWVQANIANFGGDPNNVTLGGQSAGAIDTTANLISPDAEGLFHRAITQSAPIPDNFFLTQSAALSQGTAFADAAGCSSSQCLRDLSAARVLQLQGTPNASPGANGLPVVDGTIVPVFPETAWTTGAYHHMPILGGTTKDEGTFGLAITEYFSGPPQVALTPDQYEANNSTAVKDEYPLSDYDDNPTWAQDRINSDSGLKCPALRVLNQQASTNTGFGVYGYDFTYQQSPFYFPQMPNEYNTTGPGAGYFQARAYHTADIQFVFPKWHGGNLGVNLDQATGQPRELQGPEISLSDQIAAAWTNFAKNGDPNGPGLPTWPVFTTGSGPFLAQDTTNTLETAAQYSDNYHCDFWAAQ